MTAPTELSVLPPVCAGELVLTAPRMEAPRILSDEDIAGARIRLITYGVA